MEGLKSIVPRVKIPEDNFYRHVFGAKDFQNRVRERAKKYVEKYFFKEFVEIFDDLRALSESGKQPYKNYPIFVPEELEITFASEMMTTFLKSLGYGVNIDLSSDKKSGNSGDITVNIFLPN